jgi:hypothetical protein
LVEFKDDLVLSITFEAMAPAFAEATAGEAREEGKRQRKK